MRVHTKVVYDMDTMDVIEDEFYEYDGDVVLCCGGGTGGFGGASESQGGTGGFGTSSQSAADKALADYGDYSSPEVSQNYSDVYGSGGMADLTGGSTSTQNTQSTPTASAPKSTLTPQEQAFVDAGLDINSAKWAAKELPNQKSTVLTNDQWSSLVGAARAGITKEDQLNSYQNTASKFVSIPFIGAFAKAANVATNIAKMANDYQTQQAINDVLSQGVTVDASGNITTDTSKITTPQQKLVGVPGTPPDILGALTNASIGADYLTNETENKTTKTEPKKTTPTAPGTNEPMDANKLARILREQQRLRQGWLSAFQSNLGLPNTYLPKLF